MTAFAVVAAVGALAGELGAGSGGGAGQSVEPTPPVVDPLAPTVPAAAAIQPIDVRVPLRDGLDGGTVRVEVRAPDGAVTERAEVDSESGVFAVAVRPGDQVCLRVPDGWSVTVPATADPDGTGFTCVTPAADHPLLDVVLRRVAGDGE